MRLELDKIFSFTDRDNVKSGQEGWLADSLKELTDLVESDNYNSCNFGKVFIDKNNYLYPFKNCSTNHTFSFFYLYKEEMRIEKLKIIYEKIKGYGKHIYFNHFVPIYYVFPQLYGNNRKKTIEELKERNTELRKELKCSFEEIDKLNFDISVLHDLISSVSKDIKEIIEDSNEERNVYTIVTAEGSELRIRFPELLAPVLEEYKLKSSDGVYSFEKVKDKKS